MFDVVHGRSLPQYPGDRRTDVVIDSEQNATCFQQAARLSHKPAGVRDVVENLEAANDIERRRSKLRSIKKVVGDFSANFRSGLLDCVLPWFDSVNVPESR